MFKQIVKTETKLARAESGQEMLLDYYILVDELGSAGNTVLENYGVRVAKTVTDGCQEAECCDIWGITPLYSQITALISLLSRNAVTPVAVADVLSDFLLDR